MRASGIDHFGVRALVNAVDLLWTPCASASDLLASLRLPWRARVTTEPVLSKFSEFFGRKITSMTSVEPVCMTSNLGLPSFPQLGFRPFVRLSLRVHVSLSLVMSYWAICSQISVSQAWTWRFQHMSGAEEWKSSQSLCN